MKKSQLRKMIREELLNQMVTSLNVLISFLQGLSKKQINNLGKNRKVVDKATELMKAIEEVED